MAGLLVFCTVIACVAWRFKQLEWAKTSGEAARRSLWRDNRETACKDDRYFLLGQYAGVLAISIGSEG